MKKIYNMLGKGVKIVAYLTLVFEVIEFFRNGILKIHPEIAKEDNDSDLDNG